MATRILVMLGEERIARLSKLAEERKESRSALIREAVDTFIDSSSDKGERERFLAALDAGFGLWARHGIAEDSHEYDRKRRAEWTRYWDDDYEEVRAESPDMFDAEDDRQRRIYLEMIAGRYPAVKAPDAR